jgi:hypothetical protein
MFVESKKEGEVIAMPSIAPLEPWRRWLLNGADILERQGLAKCTEYDKVTGAVCFIGAVFWADQGRPSASTGDMFGASVARHAAYDKMKDFLGRCPIAWNNAAETTQNEVVSAMRACARQ